MTNPETKLTSCSSCGYPEYAGHSPQCAQLKDTQSGWDTSDIGLRSLEEYVTYTGFPFKELKGKKVLDIGSSSTQRFADEAAKHKITVVSLSPDLRLKEYRKRLEEHKKNKPKRSRSYRRKWKELAIAAIAENLPFKDSSFDAEVGLMSITNYWNNMDQYKRGFAEIIRTLKPGGKAYLYPITKDFYFSEDFHKMLDSFRVHIIFESLETEADERTEKDLYVDKRLIIEKKI